ncbi:MAG: serine protease [bacterium]
MLSTLAPSVVKIVCYADAEGDKVQGSGVLYHSASGTPFTYFVETSLHVVKTSDGIPSKCLLAVYPNYSNSANYLVYQTNGYITYKEGTDFAYIIPQLTTETETPGTMAQLAKYAKNFTTSLYCSNTSIGDHISILGYPSIGGSSLTATDGIISGYELDDDVRFIKTSAKIEHGNSGGVAIKNSGCILGIPTFIQAGSIESIGRILDLNALFAK